jgi:hypothetical protein
MNPSRLLIGLLLLATVLVDAVAFLTARQTQFPHPAEILFGSLADSQISLLAIWTGMGRKWSPWRMLGTVLGICAWSWLGASAEDTSYFGFQCHTSLWAVGLMAQALYIVVPLSIAGFAGIELVDAARNQPGLPSGTRPPRAQFFLADLLGWLTAVALFLSIVPYVVHYDELLAMSFLWSRLLILPAEYAPVAIAALWAVLGTRRPWFRAIVLCLVTAGIIAAESIRLLPATPQFHFGREHVLELLLAVVLALAGLCAVLGRRSLPFRVILACVVIGGMVGAEMIRRELGPATPQLDFALRCVLQMLLLAGSLWVFRVAGYRLVWARGKPAMPPQS